MLVKSVLTVKETAKVLRISEHFSPYYIKAKRPRVSKMVNGGDKTKK